jgi:FKBP-type peptidyl-prolyl cis-trans isomerase
VVFFVSSFALSAMVIWEQFLKKDSSSKNASTSQTDKNKPKEGALQGTKLADFTPVDSVSELQIIDLKEGDGDTVEAGATVTAHYTGALAKDGTIFQSSHDMGQAVAFPLSGVIQGWQEGVPGMKVGGKRRIVIPAEKAYGAQEQQGIPANSDLVFDIELVKIGE